jgi:hypothetical protein
MELQQELGSGESLLWQGQPEQRIIFHTSDWAAIPFSLMWGGFAIFWELSVTGLIGMGHPPKFVFNVVMMFFGVPFVLIGQYMIWGRFLYAAWQKARTHYAVTSKRVLVVYSGATRKLHTASLASLDSISLTTRADGAGSVEFAPFFNPNQPFFGPRKRRNNLSLNIDLDRLALLDIADARSVYQLIQRQRDRLLAPPF